MNALVLATAIFLTGADASFADAAKAVSASASVLQSLVDGWSSPDGLPGALGIQTGGYPQLSSAVGALSQSGASLADADVDVEATNNLATSIVALLGSLTKKAGDFKAVSADSIVQNDLKELQGPSVDIVNDIVKAVSADCDKVGSLTSALGAFGSAFDEVDNAYGLATSSWPAAPSCDGNGGSPSGPSSPTGPITSPSNSTSTSTKPSGNKNSTSTKPSGNKNTTSSKTKATSNKATSTPIVPKNSTSSAPGQGSAVTETTVVSKYTTYCPSPTTLVTNGRTYTVTEATTLTITDCPCTVPKPPPSKSGEKSVPPANPPPKSSSPVVPSNGGVAAAVGAGAAIAGAVALLI